MSPTISPDGEVLVYDRFRVLLSRLFKNMYKNPIKNGNIVIAYSKDDPNLRVCKRVIAKEGDIVTLYPNYSLVTTIDHGNIDLVLNKEMRDNNSYCNILVPKDHYWIQGDNLMNSRDSRHYGPIHESMIIGKVIYRMVSLKDYD